MDMAMGTKSYINLHILSYLYANFHAFVKCCTIFSFTTVLLFALYVSSKFWGFSTDYKGSLVYIMTV